MSYRCLWLFPLFILFLGGCYETRSRTGLPMSTVGTCTLPLAAKKVQSTAVCAPDAQGQLLHPRLEVPEPEPVLGIGVDPAFGEVLLQTAHGIRVWDQGFGRQRHAHGESAGVGFGAAAEWPNGRLHLAIDPSDGSVVIKARGQHSPLAHIYLSHTGWAVVDTHGRFDGDASQWEQWRWSDGTHTINFRQLSDLYYEPALLGRLASGAVLDTATAPPIAAGIPLPPSVRLDAYLSPDQKTLLGTVEAHDQGGCVAALRLFHNGKAMPLTVTSVAATGMMRAELRLAASPGANELTAIATSKLKVESVPTQRHLTSHGQKPSKGRLHLLAIGIDHYASPTLTLNFAVADARGIVEWVRDLSQTTDTLFRQIRVVELYEAAATREQIRQALADLEKTAPEDTVLLYLAGHGENDGVRWYFLPTGFGRDISLAGVAREGLSSTELRDALLRVPARHIAVVVDACKSGDLNHTFSAATDDRYMEWMSRTAGIHLLAATDQNQLAVELPELGHGALTFALLQGLDGAADASPADRIVMARELFRYSSTELPKLTRRLLGQAQFPTQFDYGTDFPLQGL